jgi:hypothetical protein
MPLWVGTLRVMACCRGELPVESLKLLHRKAQLLETLLGSLVPVSMDDLADDSTVFSHFCLQSCLVR